MTEKTYNGIETAITVVVSTGVDWVVNKTVDNFYKPEKLPEKILAGIGKFGVSMACNYGVYKVVHGMMHPYEDQQLPALVQQYNDAVKFNSEVATIMAQHQVKVENAVDDILKQMEGMANG